MSNRQKPISREEIEEVKVILKNRNERLTRLMTKATNTGKPLTNAEEKEVKGHLRFIKENQKLVREYYKPAMIIE